MSITASNHSEGPADVHFRRANSEDAESVARIHADSWRRHYRGAYSDSFLDGDVESDRLRVWNDRLSNPDGRASTILAEDGNVAIGFVHVIFGEDARYGSLIDNLHVASGRRRAGIGTELMCRAAVAVAERGAGGLYLWVLEQNSAAQEFYEALGGKYAGRRLVQPPGGIPGRLNGSPMTLRYAWSNPGALTG
jgi:ribosomal protein S18 acetylase RimI-like enzyme